MTAKAAAHMGTVAQNLLQTFVIVCILFIAIIVVGCMRLYCWLSPGGHQWVSSPGDDMFIPTIPDQCNRCGKQRRASTS